MKEFDKQIHYIKEPKSKWWQIISFQGYPGPLRYLIHADRLRGLKVESFRFVPSIEDFEAKLSYEDYEIDFEMHYNWTLLISADPEVPEEIFRTVAEHFDTYYKVPWKEVEIWKKQFEKNTKATWIEK